MNHEKKKRSAKRVDDPKEPKKPSELEGLHFTILEDWVNKGSSETLPEEMELYLRQLNTVNGLWNACNSPQNIIRKLCLAYPELNQATAKSRYEDAMTWFYLDEGIKMDAFSNMIAEQMLKLATATVKSATCNNDYKIAGQLFKDAWLIKGGDKPQQEKIPDSAFSKPIKIYSTDVTEFTDLPATTNRNLLGEWVDDMNLTESKKLKLKQEIGLEPKELFDQYAKPKED